MQCLQYLYLVLITGHKMVLAFKVISQTYFVHYLQHFYGLYIVTRRYSMHSILVVAKEILHFSVP